MMQPTMTPMSPTARRTTRRTMPMPRRAHLFVLVLFLALSPAAAPRLAAQISVNPTGVNVNAFAETVVFLTYGGLANHDAVDAIWCAEIVDAFPDVGFRCDPTTILGGAPPGFDLATPSGMNGLTDLMTIPASVTRRAYERARAGENSEFFYVRQFRSRVGGPDVFVPVTCRLAGGGARVPFAILDARLSFDVDVPVLTVPVGEQPPPFAAELRYNGTGLLVARWEIVLPGDELPSNADLFPEGALPVERRTERRPYLEVGRVSEFLPPSGDPVRIPGPDPARLPVDIEGGYQILLRIEATADREGDTNLAAVGAGGGVVHTGGVAPFAIPPLRYHVGSATIPAADARGRALHAVGPTEGAIVSGSEPIGLVWGGAGGAALVRVEIEDEHGEPAARALLGPGATRYRLPPWVGDATGSDAEGAPRRTLRWRVVTLTDRGRVIEATPWVTFHIARPDGGDR